jgi:hypothetical protein
MLEIEQDSVMYAVSFKRCFRSAGYVLESDDRSCIIEVAVRCVRTVVGFSAHSRYAMFCLMSLVLTVLLVLLTV